SRRYEGIGSPRSSSSAILACAMSRATTSGPVSATRVRTGYLVSSALISSIGRVRSMATTSPSDSAASKSGRYCAGSVSSCSRNTPSLVIFPSACRSAEQDTAIATGHEAPCRGSRTTRTSWQKYLPPNCAPIPMFLVMPSTCSSSSRSRNPCAESDPDVGSPSRYLADAYLAVFSANSALVPPITTARWYGGQAAVPSPRIFSSRNDAIRFGFSTALVSWNRNDLLAEPPPLAMNRNLYSSPPVAYSSIWAGRLLPVLRSSHMVSGASWE